MAASLLATPGVAVLTTFVPGINRLPRDWAEGTTVTGPFAFPGTGYRHWPTGYGALARHLGRAPALDTVVVQVSPPNAAGRCSLGPAAAFSAIALARPLRRIAVINAAIPGSGDLRPFPWPTSTR